jgi:hypothetical protein
MNWSQAIEGRLKIAEGVMRPEMRRFLGESLTSAQERRGINPAALEMASDEVIARTYAGALYGSPFYWSPEMCAVISAVAVDMPDWTLTPEMLCVRSGFFWFSEPLALPLWDGERADLAAVGWHLMTDNDGLEVVQTAAFTNTRLDSGVPPLPSNVAAWKIGTTYSDALAFRDGAMVGYPDRYEAMFRYFACALSFINQSIFVTRHERATRATRKRAEAVLSDSECEVRVVQLRKRANPGEQTGEARSVEWSHQWVVSGHWRQQFYPSTGEHRPIFVLPYVKGPEDKPLKAPAERVFAVVR